MCKQKFFQFFSRLHVNALLLFTRFCRNEISCADELIPVKQKGMKFHPAIKKKKNRRVNTSSKHEI